MSCYPLSPSLASNRQFITLGFHSFVFNGNTCDGHIVLLSHSYFLQNFKGKPQAQDPRRLGLFPTAGSGSLFADACKDLGLGLLVRALPT